jgi:hypothetical protein
MTVKPLPPIILENIKDNKLTPPNDLKIVSQMPKSVTKIDDDLTLVTQTMIVTYMGMTIAVVYLEIDDGIGSQAIDAFLID